MQMTPKRNCQIRPNKHKSEDLVCLRAPLSPATCRATLSLRSKSKRRSVPKSEPRPPAASTSEVHKYNWKENERKESSLEGQQHKWHNCLESPATRCESGRHQVSINRQRSLLAMTAVRLPGRLRGGGKVLPCRPLICAFTKSRQHTASSCYCSSDATHILQLMLHLLIVMLSFRLDCETVSRTCFTLKLFFVIRHSYLRLWTQTSNCLLSKLRFCFSQPNYYTDFCFSSLKCK